MATQPSNPISDERNFRPKPLYDFIGQGDLKMTLRLMLSSAQKWAATLEYVVFYGAPGLGKTTLAAIIAAEQDARFHELAAPSIQKVGDLANILAMLQQGGVLSLDECHTCAVNSPRCPIRQWRILRSPPSPKAAKGG